MWAQVIGAVVGGVAGGVVNGIIASETNKNKVTAYQEAAKQIKDAADKYSGQEAYNKMQNLGNQEAANFNRNTLAAGGQMDNASGTAAMNAADLSNANGTLQGYSLGTNNAKATMDAKSYRDTALARNTMKQADIDYNAANQTAQTAMNAASGLTDLYKDLKSNSKKANDNTSDENQKEGINNESGLPESDIEDSMRQLETISYKYKDPSVPGCDGEKHESGFTAQSAEKTPLFGDAVSTGDDGIKRIDQWKLMESLTAGIAQLQREIDALEGEKK